MVKKLLLGIIGIVVVLIIIGIAAGGGTKPQNVEEKTQAGQQEIASPKAESQEFKVGDQVKLNNAVLTVNEVGYSSGGQFTKPAEGNEWVNLNITIENTGSNQQYVTTLGQMFLSDGDSNSYQIAVTDKQLQNPGFGLDGTIIPKTKRTGWVGFEIKKGATGLKFQYNASIWGGGTIVVKLDR